MTSSPAGGPAADPTRPAAHPIRRELYLWALVAALLAAGWWVRGFSFRAATRLTVGALSIEIPRDWAATIDEKAARALHAADPISPRLFPTEISLERVPLDAPGEGPQDLDAMVLQWTTTRRHGDALAYTVTRIRDARARSR